jgi:histidinol-phosphate aminotransferase
MNIKQLIRPNIRQLKPYSSARHEFEGSAEIFLDANENPFGNGINRYPDPLQQVVKEQLSGLKEVPAGQIFLGNGSDEAIDLLIRIFCEPREDKIIILPPTYGMYRVSADIADVAVVEVPLRPAYQPDVEAILKVTDPHTKILFLCSPNNPTGNDFMPDALRTLASRFPGIVVVDEAYIDFSERESCTRRLPEFPNLVVLQTFSKAWGMAGIRLGMAFASEEIIRLLNKVKPPYNVNHLTQQAALEALQDPEAQQAQVRKILAERKHLADTLPAFEFVEQVYPSDANFLLVKVTDPDGLYQFLVDQGIIVRNRSRALRCEGSLRFTIGTPAENELLLKCLQYYGSKAIRQ